MQVMSFGVVELSAGGVSEQLFCQAVPESIDLLMATHPAGLVRATSLRGRKLDCSNP